MSFRNKVKSHAAVVLTSERLQSARRTVREIRRRLSGTPHVVQYFHDVSDPYCHLSVQLLGQLRDKYDVRIEPHLMSRPTSDILPAPEQYRHNVLLDSVRWAKRLGLNAPGNISPEGPVFDLAERRLAAELNGADFVKAASQISQMLWSAKDIPDWPQADPIQARADGDRALQAAGQYLGGTVSYGGECYWGPDRLAYLETRLETLGLGQANPFIVPEISEPTLDAAGQELEFFFSFRSPYSYLALDRVRDLTARSNAKLILRPVLPMLMRGLPVPSAKSSYILKDCAREARRLGIPFGRISDPLGAGVERGYALLDHAEAQGRLAEYCSSFMTAVWSKGMDASTDAGLAYIVTAAGLDWNAARGEIESSHWRDRVEANQARLQQIGLWGVPSFHLAGQSVWGQDRLWVLADLLRGKA
ncbi:DsbA family protein [Ruegeria lacuscaerulensis]|uniref:DsbA family protein n=1 Tax=Ruegeria lacuscaerulensis TaxID=55218 RepID=UPI00147D6A18|nr:DsbA family protein [Ruegeria lacuscaerulensis]